MDEVKEEQSRIMMMMMMRRRRRRRRRWRSMSAGTRVIEKYQNLKINIKSFKKNNFYQL